MATEEKKTVQYRLEIPEDIHAEMKKVSDETGISLKQIILDGAKCRIHDLKKMFRKPTVSDYSCR